MTTYKREDLRRVLFSGLSEQCDESLLHELCIQFGPVAKITWPTDTSINGSPQRMTYCFVDFYSSEDAKYCFEALYRSRVKLFDKELRVSHGSTELGQREAGARFQGRHAVHELHEIGAKLEVRNVDYAATEYDITFFFKQFGEFAVPPKMVRDYDGNFRGVVVLSYKDFEASDRALGMDKRVYRDRTISVQYAPMEDGSGRRHGTDEERANAALVREEERKYLAKVQAEVIGTQRERQQNRIQDTTWADNVDVHSGRR